jgi:hypothetical protein
MNTTYIHKYRHTLDDLYHNVTRCPQPLSFLTTSATEELRNHKNGEVSISRIKFETLKSIE